MRKIVYALSVYLLMVVGVQASLIGRDNFDGTTNYLTKVNSDTRNSTSLTWSEVSRATVNAAPVIDTSVQAGGAVVYDAADILGFLGTNKTDKVFGLHRGGNRTLTYTFNIAGYTNLNLAMDWAASGNFNTDPGITMTASIDGGAIQSIFTVGSSTTDWIEKMDDGRAVTNGYSASVALNGAAGTSLSDVFKTYTPTIAGTGSVLTLTLKMISTTAGYSLGMDNLALSGTAIPEPATIGMLGLGAVITLLVRRMKI
jgi:hypothetical protein